MVNEGKLDRFVRFVVGILFIFGSILLLKDTLRIVFLIIGIISLITSLTGFCLLYKVFGFNTLPKKKK